MYRQGVLAILLTCIVACGTSSAMDQADLDLTEAPVETIEFDWRDGDRLQVEKIEHRSTTRGDFQLKCDFTLAVQADGDQLVIRQQDLLPQSPLPSPTGHRPFDLLYRRFQCALPAMRVSADGRILGVTGAKALAARIQPVVLAYYRAHPARYEAGLAERVARRFAAPMLEYQATAFWSAIVGEWVGKSIEQLEAAAAEDTDEETVTAVQSRTCPGQSQDDQHCITIRYENWLDRRDLVDSYSGKNERAESAITTSEGSIVLHRTTGYPVVWQEDLTTTIEVRRLDDGQTYSIEGLVRRKYTFELVDGD